MTPLDLVENGSAALRRNIQLQRVIQELETRMHAMQLELDLLKKERTELQFESRRLDDEANELARKLTQVKAKNERLELMYDQLEQILTTRESA